MNKADQEEAVRRYLRTGDHDELFFGWPGQNILETAINGDAAHRRALIEEVKRRESLVPRVHAPAVDVVGLARRKVEPMVRGLFPRGEQAIVLAMLEKSVVFLTPENIGQVLEGESFLRAAWDIANLYLGSIDAELLGEQAPQIVGLSQETTCYVSVRYFTETHRFADFIVHEAAHVFHNCKRLTVGLPETRRREWLLEIDFRKRETFAYACEAFSRVVELAPTLAARPAMIDECVRTFAPGDEHVDVDEFADILRGAACARNGWKQILARCAPQREYRSV